jgi:hypothetical protein
MFAEMNQVFAGADVQYRQERVATDLSQHRRSIRISWPTVVFRPRPRHPRAPRPMPAPHNMSSAA